MIVERPHVEVAAQDELDEVQVARVSQRPHEAPEHDGHEARLDRSIAAEPVDTDDKRGLVLTLRESHHPRPCVLYPSRVRPLYLGARTAKGQQDLVRKPLRR